MVATCQLTTATIVPYPEERGDGAPRFAMRISNDSNRVIALPASPQWGWRVDVWEKGDWRVRKEAGPVRRISDKDEHIVVTGESGGTPLVEIGPGHRDTLFVKEPALTQALQPDKQFSRLRLTLYWAPSEQFAAQHREVLPCALAAAWVVDAQKLDGDPNAGLKPVKTR